MRSRILVPLVVLVLCATAAPGLDFTPPGCEPPLFSDVASADAACPWVQQAARDGVVPGCGGGLFCPEQTVTRGQAAASLERAMRGTSTWTPGYYARTVVVHPVPGDPQASGAALLAAVEATAPATIMNRYLIKLEPGIYEVSGSFGVQLRSYVELEGSGVGVTTIVAKNLLDLTLVSMAGETAVRFLTVRSESTDGHPFSVSAYGAGLQRLSHVRVESLHGSAVSCEAGALLRIDHARMESQNFAALRVSSCDATVEDSDLAVNKSQGPVTAVTVANSVLRLRRSEVVAGSVNGSNRAVEAYQTTLFLEGVQLRADGGPYPAALVKVVHLLRSSATIVASDLQAMGSTSSRWALHAESDTGAFVTRARESRFANGEIQASANDDIFIAASQLDQAAVNPNGGTITCHKSFDEAFANPGGLSVCP